MRLIFSVLALSLAISSPAFVTDALAGCKGKKACKMKNGKCQNKDCKDCKKCENCHEKKAEAEAEAQH